MSSIRRDLSRVCLPRSSDVIADAIWSCFLSSAGSDQEDGIVQLSMQSAVGYHCVFYRTHHFSVRIDVFVAGESVLPIAAYPCYLISAAKASLTLLILVRRLQVRPSLALV